MKNKPIFSLLFISFLCLMIFLSCSDDNKSSYVETGGTIEVRNTSAIAFYNVQLNDGRQGWSTVRPGGYITIGVYQDGYYDVYYYDRNEGHASQSSTKYAYVSKGRTVVVEIP